jgi:MFS family permease
MIETAMPTSALSSAEQAPRHVADSVALLDSPVEGRRRAPIVALLTGNAVSLVGNQLAGLAIPWFVLQTTGSAAKTGLVAAFTLLPTAAAMLFGGALADRLGHRRTSVVSDLLSAGTVAAVPLLSQTVGLPFPLLLALAFLGAVFDAPGSTARSALIPEAAALARTPLERANGVAQAFQSLAGLVGPLLAGGLIALIGASNVLWLDAASFLVSAVAIGVLVPDVRAAAAVRNRFVDEVKEGWRFLIGDPLLRTFAGLAVVINFLAAPLFAVLLPVLVNEAYGSPGVLGVAIAAIGGGTLVGALNYGAVGARLPRRPVLIWSFALAWAPLLAWAFETPLWVAVLANVLCGLGLGPLNPIVFTVMQERVPLELRARVLGALVASSMIAAPAGVLLAGGLVELVGARATIGAIAVGLTLMTVPLLLSRSLHDLGGRSEASTPAAEVGSSS